MYIFGGISVKNNDVKDREWQQNPELMEPEYEYTSFEYMDDLWRFDLESEQWENIEVYGIASIRREIYLWNGTSIFTDVSSQNKLKKDLNNINIK